MTTTGNDEPGGRKDTGRWDLFKSFRRTISPEERMALLQIKLPIQPPEDFMNTVELRRLRFTRFRDKLRRFVPILIGLGVLLAAVLAAVLAAGIWRSSSSLSSRAPATASEVDAATQPNADRPASVANSNLPPTAEPLASLPLPAPSDRASALPSTATPQTQAPRQGTSAHAPLKVAPSAAPASSAVPPAPASKAPKHPSDELDVDTPLAPPVH